jgi:hypothetical protein
MSPEYNRVTVGKAQMKEFIKGADRGPALYNLRSAARRYAGAVTR